MISRTCLASCHACAIRSPALGADAIDSLQFGGPVLDHGENLGSETPTSFFARIGPIPLTKPLPRYARSPRRWSAHRLHALALNCSPCSLSLTHWPSPASHSRRSRKAAIR